MVQDQLQPKHTGGLVGHGAGDEFLEVAVPIAVRVEVDIGGVVRVEPVKVLPNVRQAVLVGVADDEVGLPRRGAVGEGDDRIVAVRVASLGDTARLLSEYHRVDRLVLCVAQDDFLAAAAQAKADVVGAVVRVVIGDETQVAVACDEGERRQYGLVELGRVVRELQAGHRGREDGAVVNLQPIAAIFGPGHPLVDGERLDAAQILRGVGGAGGGGVECPWASAVGGAPDREVVRLRAKANGVLYFQAVIARPPKRDVLAIGIEGESGVQAGLLLRVIAPHDEVRLRGEPGAGREKEGRLFADAIAESGAGQVDLAAGRIVQLDPVRIGVPVFHRATVGSHQLVEDDAIRQALDRGTETGPEREVAVVGGVLVHLDREDVFALLEILPRELDRAAQFRITNRTQRTSGVADAAAILHVHAVDFLAIQIKHRPVIDEVLELQLTAGCRLVEVERFAEVKRTRPHLDSGGHLVFLPGRALADESLPAWPSGVVVVLLAPGGTEAFALGVVKPFLVLERDEGGRPGMAAVAETGLGGGQGFAAL